MHHRMWLNRPPDLWQELGSMCAPAEICSGADDDCNGLVDDGLESSPKRSVTERTTTATASSTRSCFNLAHVILSGKIPTFV